VGCPVGEKVVGGLDDGEGLVEFEGIASVYVGDEDEVALGGKAVGEELVILPDAEDVGNEEDGLVGVQGAGGWCCKVGRDGYVWELKLDQNSG
jgi:hypothetical protein